MHLSVVIQMRSFYILILGALISSPAYTQTVSTGNVETYDYDTTLKGGYTISFKLDDSLQYLLLKKGNRMIAELSSTSLGLPYKNLGYVGADFANHFVLVHSFGSGNPHYIELIKKMTGENLLEDGVAWIDVEKKNEFLLYSVNDVPDEKDSMTLFNVKTGQRQNFSFPSDIFDAPQVLNRIQISKLTDKQLVIKYDTEKGTRTKAYKR